MIRCDNCGTNNVDGSEYCVRLELAPPPLSHKRDVVPVYQPPSAVDTGSVGSNTMDGPLPAPPSFTTSTSIPKPAVPARERQQSARKSNASRRQTNERS